MSSLLEQLERHLPRVSKPARYIGNELNMASKDTGTVDLRMVLSYPDIYEIGMSNIGIRILYEAVNDVPNLSCERVFAPWHDFEEVLRRNGIPLFSLESFTPLVKFDVMGFSLGYELLYSNLLNILDLGEIPLRSAERGEECPIVIAGGPSSLNPEPLADFIDVFLLGDGEKALVDFLLALVHLKGTERREKLLELNRMDFAYVPSLYGTRRVRGHLFTDVDKTVKRRIEPDLDALPFPKKPLVPLMRIVQERVNVEVSRGCATGCRFCQAGFIYRPVRERSIGGIMDIVETNLKQTGYDEVSLVSLNVGEYSELESLVRRLRDRFAPDGVSVSLPSLKVSSVNLRVLELIQEVRKSGLTFAVESADACVRSALNKLVDEEQLGEIISKVTALGWRLIKLYFMIGLPMAKDEGEAIARFVLGLMEVSPRLAFNVNVSVFVPKPHTPFEREEQLGVDEAERIIQFLRKRFRRSKVRIKFQNPRMSLVEGLLSRGDRNMGRAIEEAFRLGERFSSWDEMFDYRKWEMALNAAGVDPASYLLFDKGSGALPWDFIDTGVGKRFLSEELERARGSAVTENCLSGACSGCGVCGGDVRNRKSCAGGGECVQRGMAPLASEGETLSGIVRPGNGKARSGITEGGQGRIYKILFQFTKKELFRYLAHLDLLYLFARVMRSTGLPVDYTKGFNPKTRLIIPFPLLLGAESDYELGEVFVHRVISPDEFVERVNGSLRRGLQITRAKIMSDRKSIASKQFVHEYRVTPGEGWKTETEGCCRMITHNGSSGEGVIECVPLGTGSFSLRLKGSASIKKVLTEGGLPLPDCAILRTGIREDKGGIFTDFFE